MMVVDMLCRESESKETTHVNTRCEVTLCGALSEASRIH